MRYFAAGLALASLLLIGCPKPTPTPNNPIDQPAFDLRSTPPGHAAACATTEPDLRPSDVCDGFFTSEGLACARCKQSSGCVVQDIQTYCTTGACAEDPHCSVQR